MSLLEIHNLHASAAGKEILRGIDLTINPGEVHAVMGPNGAGKSTLSAILTGNPQYEVTQGEILYKGRNLLEMKPEERAWEGIFLSFQYPVEIPGVSMVNFMRTAVNAQREYRGLPALTATEFLRLMREKRAVVQLDNKLANRSVNEGFSGGEKKRNEIFQMAMLEPTLSIKSAERSSIVITHYQKLLEYVQPQFVHIVYRGRIVKSGGPELGDRIFAEGFDWVKQEFEG